MDEKIPGEKHLQKHQQKQSKRALSKLLLQLPPPPPSGDGPAPRFTHQNLTCFESGVSHFSSISLSGNRGWPTSFKDSFQFGVNTELVMFFPGLH